MRRGCSNKCHARFPASTCARRSSSSCLTEFEALLPSIDFPEQNSRRQPLPLRKPGLLVFRRHHACIACCATLKPRRLVEVGFGLFVVRDARYRRRVFSATRMQVHVDRAVCRSSLQSLMTDADRATVRVLPLRVQEATDLAVFQRAAGQRRAVHRFDARAARPAVTSTTCCSTCCRALRARRARSLPRRVLSLRIPAGIGARRPFVERDLPAARVDDGCISASRSPTTRAWTLVGDNVTIEIVDDAGHPPPRRTARRRQRPTDWRFLSTSTKPASRAPAPAARRPRRRREGGVRDVPDGRAAARGSIAAPADLTVYTQDDPAFPAGVGARSHDADLAVSWHHDIETVPTLIRVDGEESGAAHVRLAARPTGSGSPGSRTRRRPARDAPGCGSMSVDPDRVDSLARPVQRRHAALAADRARRARRRDGDAVRPRAHRRPAGRAADRGAGAADAHRHDPRSRTRSSPSCRPTSSRSPSRRSRSTP